MIALEKSPARRPWLNESSCNASATDKPLRALTPKEPGKECVGAAPIILGITRFVPGRRESSTARIVTRLLLRAIAEYSGIECTRYFRRQVFSEERNEPLVIT